jgi:hypothetical protein
MWGYPRRLHEGADGQPPDSDHRHKVQVVRLSLPKPSIPDTNEHDLDLEQQKPAAPQRIDRSAEKSPVTRK